MWPHDLTDDKQNTLLKFLPLPHALQVFWYSVIYTTNLEQKKKLFQVLLSNFKNNIQYKTTSWTGVKFMQLCYLKPLEDLSI